MALLLYITQVPARFFTKFNFEPFKFAAISSEISHCKIFSGIVKTVVIAWVIWLIYIILLETAAPKVIYEPKENITLTSLIAIPITGHILTFLAIHTNNRKISSVTHNSQQAILFKREKKGFQRHGFVHCSNTSDTAAPEL